MKPHLLYHDQIFHQNFVILLIVGKVCQSLTSNNCSIYFSLKKSTTERADLNALLVGNT